MSRATTEVDRSAVWSTAIGYEWFMNQVEVWRGAHGDPAPLFGPLPGIRLGDTPAYEFQAAAEAASCGSANAWPPDRTNSNSNDVQDKGVVIFTHRGDCRGSGWLSAYNALQLPMTRFPHRGRHAVVAELLPLGRTVVPLHDERGIDR
jgi:hypothetical protein